MESVNNFLFLIRKTKIKNMKKPIFLIVLLAAFTGMSAQQVKSDSISLTKATLSKSKSIIDLDKNIPRNAKIQGVEMVAKVKGKVKNAVASTAEWSKDMRSMLDSADARTKIYIDFKYKVPPDEKIQMKAIIVKVE